MTCKIVVEPGCYDFHNMGDTAMMQVAVARLRELWPQAEIGVITSRPELLASLCPGADPIDVRGRHAWSSGRSLTGRFGRMLPRRFCAALQALEHQLWLRFPRLTELWVIGLAKALGRVVPPSSSGFRERLTRADLLVISGMGAINDAFQEKAKWLLDEIKAVVNAGVPVVAFGQGLGPITDPALLAKARDVLPRLTLIGVREGQTGKPLLESLGFERSKIRVTGDDAIDLAYEARPRTMGDAIGVNLRIANYAGTDECAAGRLRAPLRRAAEVLNSSLLPVPISLHDETDSDVEALNTLLEGRLPSDWAPIERPLDAIRAIGKCRVVVTGSYHGGVFALAQGIPAVGMVYSPYYEQKFMGLQKQFPSGCRVLDFRQSISESQIEEAICGAWESAKRNREALLAEAVRQIDLSRAAYRAAHQLCPLGEPRRN